ncbi:DUF4142 domain-containing protein [Runella sp.]|uniref:DUF4142 domain-containing protein n=1 Tax=Runella sp. TaxID=1960881 RepID=UPI003D0A5BBE
MKTKLIWVSALVMMWGFTACNSSSNSESQEAAKDSTEASIDAMAPSDSAAMAMKEDADFMMEAASGGMMEVELGQLASNKAVSSDVKKFAKMIVTDHTKANNELKALASQKNITIPAMLSEKHQKMVNDLTAKTGKEFDKKYIDMMVDDHKEDIKKFEKASEKCNDADVKAFAAKTLPTLKHHLEMAEKTEKMTDKM